MRRTEVSEEMRRLVRVLMRWTKNSLSAVASDAGVSKGNLSRLLTGKGTPGMGATKTAAVLSRLQWGARGPTQGTVHTWTLESGPDLEWMFKTILSGQAAVHPLLTDEAAASQLEHQGVLLGRIANAWFVLTDAGSIGSSSLSQLLDSRYTLAKAGTTYVIPDPRAYQKLASGTFSLAELPSLLAGDEPLPAVSQDVADQLSPHLERWLTVDHLKCVLHDAAIQHARCFRASRVALVISELSENFTQRNSSLPSRAALDAMRVIADKDVDALAGQAFVLDWGPTSPHPLKRQRKTAPA